MTERFTHDQVVALFDDFSRIREQQGRRNIENDRWVALEMRCNIDVTGVTTYERGGFFLTKKASSRRAHLRVRVPFWIASAWAMAWLKVAGR